MKLKKPVALLLALALTLGLTGCIGNLYENAITLDGTEISSGMYLMIQMTAYNEASSLVDKPEVAEGEEDAAASTAEEDLFKQTVEGVKAKEWIEKRTEELCRKYVLVDRLCQEKGIVLDEENKSYMDQVMGNWSMMESYYTERGISENTMRRYMASESLAELLFENLYSADGELAPTDEEMKAEYIEKNAHVRYISIPLTVNDEALTDKTAEVTAEAKTLLEALRGGKTMEQVAEEDLAPLYEMLSRDFDATTATDYISDSYLPYEPDNYDTYSEAFLQELKGLKTSEYGFYAMSTTGMLYQKLEPFATEEKFAEMRTTIAKSLYEDQFDEYLKSIYDTYKVSYPAGAEWYFRPAKLNKA